MTSANSPTSPTNSEMPPRAATGMSDELGDPSDPLYMRFKAWRSVLGNLSDYFEYVESMHKSQAKEYAKLAKIPEVPFKTAEFAPDGIPTIWQAMRDKSTQMANFHNEQAAVVKSGILTDLARMRNDLKKHLNELDKEGVQGSKKVGKRLDKFSDQTQSLGKWIPVAETNPTSLDAHHDPYVLHRQIRHKLHHAIEEENALNESLMQLQYRCQHYERKIIQEVQKVFKENSEHMSKESQYHLTIANELSAIAMGVPPEKEWDAFNNREPSLLKPDHKPRDPADAVFPLHDHPLTKPVLQTTLARKSTMLKRRQTAYYVLSPAGFLLEYKDNDHVNNPEPTLSLKLSDCDLGNPPSRSGKPGFTLRGKDAGKSMGRTHEYVFQTDNMEQATAWWNKISTYVGSAPRTEKVAETDSEGEASPVDTKQPTAAAAPGQAPALQQPQQTAAPTQNKPQVTAAPTTATPASPTKITQAAGPTAAPTST